MKITCLLLLFLCPLAQGQAGPRAEGVLRPLPWGVRFQDADGIHRTPEIGEGVTHPTFSSAGAPHRPVMGGALRAFPGQRVTEAQGARPATASNRVRGHSGVESQKVNRPKQLPNRRQGSPTGNPMDHGQPGSSRFAAVEKSGFVRSETVNNTLAARAPSAVRPAAPSFSNVRHRNPNPAVVGGAPNSRSSNSAPLNGTRMNRRE